MDETYYLLEFGPGDRVRVRSGNGTGTVNYVPEKPMIDAICKLEDEGRTLGWDNITLRRGILAKDRRIEKLEKAIVRAITMLNVSDPYSARRIPAADRRDIMDEVALLKKALEDE